MVAQVVQMFLFPASSRLSSQGEAASLKALTEKAILFLSLGLLPVTVILLGLPEICVDILYGGRYTDAVPLIRIFSLLTFTVPLAAVASNVIMGLGHARSAFHLGLQSLAVSLALFLVFVPLFGPTGACIGYVAASVFIAFLSARALHRHLPLSARGILVRTGDITAFLRQRWSTFTSHTSEPPQ
jgi:O-antigen/teichoic acid export membrane protein